MPRLGTAVIHSRVLFPQGNLLGLTAFSLSCLSVRLNNHNQGNSYWFFESKKNWGRQDLLKLEFAIGYEAWTIRRYASFLLRIDPILHYESSIGLLPGRRWAILRLPSWRNYPSKAVATDGSAPLFIIIEIFICSLGIICYIKRP